MLETLEHMCVRERIFKLDYFASCCWDSSRTLRGESFGIIRLFFWKVGRLSHHEGKSSNSTRTGCQFRSGETLGGATAFGSMQGLHVRNTRRVRLGGHEKGRFANRP